MVHFHSLTSPINSLQHNPLQPHYTHPIPDNKMSKPIPQNHQIFDSWNTGSTGHQRADGPTLSQTTAWRDTRAQKLGRQFASGDCLDGGCGSDNGEWKWIKEDKDTAQEKGNHDIRSFMGGVQKRKRNDNDDEMGVSKSSRRDKLPQQQAQAQTPTNTKTEPNPPKDENPPRKILTGTTIYINGSTMPLISDHKLKHLLIAHGAKLSLVPARKTITHVIIGRPNANTAGNKGAGGGLAASKVQKEIERCWRGVKVVGVEWCVLHSFFPLFFFFFKSSLERR